MSLILEVFVRWQGTKIDVNSVDFSDLTPLLGPWTAVRGRSLGLDRNWHCSPAGSNGHNGFKGSKTPATPLNSQLGAALIGKPDLEIVL